MLPKDPPLLHGLLLWASSDEKEEDHMNKLKLTALLLGTVMCFGTFAGCENKKNDESDSSAVSDESEDNASENEDTESETEAFDREGYNEKIMERIEKAKVADKAPVLGKIGKTVTPAGDEKEAELGAYHESDSGVKFYYNEEEFPEELMLTLEAYFNSFADADYTAYTSCAYPEYVEKMDEYLKKEFEYDMKTSFGTNCTNLAENMKGEFKVTRIKMDVPQQYEEDKDNLEAYFESFSDVLGEGYYEKLKKEVDKIYDGEFYIMASDEHGDESLLVSAYEIVFAEKDGRYYVFG
jgi:hypothetical protein